MAREPFMDIDMLKIICIPLDHMQKTKKKKKTKNKTKQKTLKKQLYKIVNRTQLSNLLAVNNPKINKKNRDV